MWLRQKSVKGCGSSPTVLVSGPARRRQIGRGRRPLVIPAAATSTARLKAIDVQPACDSRPWTEMTAGLRPPSGTVGLGTERCHATGIPGSTYAHGGVNADR